MHQPNSERGFCKHRLQFSPRFLLIMCLLAALSAGCSRRLTRVEQGNRTGILHLGNGGEPRELDPSISSGIPESNILRALYESLVNLDPIDLHPIPGVAQSWDISEDGLTYTFHLRPEAKWSNGEPMTAQDFVGSWQRVLSPKLAGELSYFLWVLKNAEAYNHGTLTDFNQVGVHAVDDRTLRVELEHPAPYLLTSIAGRTWFPIYLPGIRKFGAVDDRNNQSWTRPGNFVGNGPFVVTDWTVNQRISAQRNPNYWDAAHNKLNEVDFYPIDDLDAEERAFRGGLLHKTGSGTIPLAKIDSYRKEHPELLRIDPYLGIYYFMLNINKPPLDDVRIRRALAMSVDRESLVKNVTRGGQIATGSFVPPNLGGYVCAAPQRYDPEAARQLLAEAGHPGGAGLPPLDLLFNTSESHRQIAEAVQQMWKKELGVEVRLSNQEWKVYLNERRARDYTICRAGWIGSFLDPLTFLEMFLSTSPINATGFANVDYDRFIEQSWQDRNPAARNHDMDQAETLLLANAPIIPIYVYTNPYLLAPCVHNWPPNLLDYHLYQDVTLQP